MVTVAPSSTQSMSFSSSLRRNAPVHFTENFSPLFDHVMFPEPRVPRSWPPSRPEALRRGLAVAAGSFASGGGRRSGRCRRCRRCNDVDCGRRWRRRWWRRCRCPSRGWRWWRWRGRWCVGPVTGPRRPAQLRVRLPNLVGFCTQARRFSVQPLRLLAQLGDERGRLVGFGACLIGFRIPGRNRLLVGGRDSSFRASAGVDATGVVAGRYRSSSQTPLVDRAARRSDPAPHDEHDEREQWPRRRRLVHRSLAAENAPHAIEQRPVGGREREATMAGQRGELSERRGIHQSIAAHFHRQIVTAMFPLGANLRRHPPRGGVVEQQRFNHRLQQVDEIVVTADVGKLVRENGV